MTSDGSLHLTYCTDIHAADGWAAVFANLRRYAPALKARLSPDAPFGVGLRLSARDARELLDGHLTELRRFLDREGLYVALINGFPHGAFHGTTVKADVYAPDWRDDARVAYTSDLIEILAALLPGGPPNVEGGISTVPLSYKPWMQDATVADWYTLTANVVHIAERLARLERNRGLTIHLDIEPEPDCIIEDTEETVAFFERWLLERGGPMLSEQMGCTPEEARALLLHHVRVCFDCCHFSVEHERPVDALGRLRAAGIQIGRIQLSSALRVAMPDTRADAAELTDRLRPFADSTYLHQVIQRCGDQLEHFPDLGDALSAGGAGEWRIHFHVPLFTADYAGLESTQDDVADVLDVLSATGQADVTRHLEIETYTWDVLPPDLKIDLLESIGREYDWVLARLCTAHTP